MEESTTEAPQPRAVDESPAQASANELPPTQTSAAALAATQAQPEPLAQAQLEPPAQAAWWRSIGSWVVAAGLLFVKFKAVLFSALSFVVSVGVYALFWGWKFALVFTLLIFVHEMGHAVFMRFYGIPASLPYFIPGFGALINLKGKPASVLHESYIALGGPFVGSLGALACFAYGWQTQSPFWIALAYTGFFLNLFNLFPVLPLDGGRVVGSISPRIWIVGFAALIAAALAFHWWNPLLLVLVLFGIPRALEAWRGTRQDDAYYAIGSGSRLVIAGAYFALCGLLIVGMLEAHVPRDLLR